MIKYTYSTLTALTDAQIEARAKKQIDLRNDKKWVKDRFKEGDKFHFVEAGSYKNANRPQYIGDTMEFVKMSECFYTIRILYYRELDAPFKDGQRKLRTISVKAFMECAVKHEN